MRVLHLVPMAGQLSEMWLGAVIEAGEGHVPHLWSMGMPSRDYHWRTSVDHVATREVRDLRVARKMEAWPPRMAAPLLWRAARAVRSAGCDVVHAHFGTLGALWSPALVPLDVPLVVSFYGIDASAHELRRPPWSGRYARLFDEAAAVMVEGPAMASRVVGLGARPEQIRLIRLPLGLPDLPSFETISDLASKARDRPYAAVMGGRFVEKKGFHLGIEAFARAFPERTERLLVIGGGPEDPRLQRVVAATGLADRIDFYPPAPMAEFARLLQTACVAVFPSITASDGDGEGGAPMTLPLAHRLGVRVVVSDHDDLPWAAADGTTVVPAGDVNALAEALCAQVATARRCDVRAVAAIRAAAEQIDERHDPVELLRRRVGVYEEASAR